MREKESSQQGGIKKLQFFSNQDSINGPNATLKFVHFSETIQSQIKSNELQSGIERPSQLNSLNQHLYTEYREQEKS